MATKIVNLQLTKKFKRPIITIMFNDMRAQNSYISYHEVPFVIGLKKVIPI